MSTAQINAIAATGEGAKAVSLSVAAELVACTIELAAIVEAYQGVTYAGALSRARDARRAYYDQAERHSQPAPHATYLTPREMAEKFGTDEQDETAAEQDADAEGRA